MQNPLGNIVVKLRYGTKIPKMTLFAINYILYKSPYRFLDFLSLLFFVIRITIFQIFYEIGSSKKIDKYQILTVATFKSWKPSISNIYRIIPKYFYLMYFPLISDIFHLFLLNIQCPPVHPYQI